VGGKKKGKDSGKNKKYLKSGRIDLEVEGIKPREFYNLTRPSDSPATSRNPLYYPWREKQERERRGRQDAREG